MLQKYFQISISRIILGKENNFITLLIVIMIKKYLFISLVLISASVNAQQQKLSEKDYAKNPYWITLSQIEGVNFIETVKAFEIYWQNHQMPEEDGDRYIGKGDEKKKKVSIKEMKEITKATDMRFKIKKFEHWKIINEPFVKENGHIMTTEEKLKFHNQHN